MFDIKLSLSYCVFWSKIMKTKTSFSPGCFLKWVSNPSKPVLCIVVEILGDEFKFIKLDDLAILTAKIDEQFEQAKKKEVIEYWTSLKSTQMNSVNFFKKTQKIFLEFQIDAPIKLASLISEGTKTINLLNQIRKVPIKLS